MTKKLFHIFLITLFLFSNPLYAQGQSKEIDTISLDFKGMDVVDVLKLIAQRGNINIAISKNVRGKVTMFLKDVDIYEAFEIILASNQLAYEKKGSILNVMTGKDYSLLYGESFHDKKIMETFELKHTNASDVSKAATQIKSKIGKIIVDEAANTLVVMDSPGIVAKIREIILTLDKPVETRVFALDYAKAEEVKSKIEEKLTKNIGLVQVDERTNKIIITDLKSKMAKMEGLIAELDERTREVLIEAKILEITLNDEFRWGVNWDRIIKLTSTLGSVAIGANFADAVIGSILPAETGSIIGSSLEVGTLDGNNFHAMFEILETIGKTEVLSSPRIVVINNEEASILVGTNQPYATTGTTVSDTVSQTTQQVTYVDLGIKLHVTPTINNDGYITMKIKPEVSSKSGDIDIVSEEGETTRTTKVPIISTSEAETTVMLKDGNTIILAGLIEKRFEEEENKIPYLSNIPILGHLFKSRTRGSSENPERKELVIFLTPHIISGDVKSPEVSEYLTTAEPGKATVVQPEKKKIDTKINPKLNFLEKTPYQDTAPAALPVSPVSLIKAPATGLSREAYYNLVKNKVLNKISENYPRSNVSGDINVSFEVTSDGVLYGKPKIASPADATLKTLVLKSVEDASPFPVFPETIPESTENFKLTISYK